MRFFITILVDLAIVASATPVAIDTHIGRSDVAKTDSSQCPTNWQDVPCTCGSLPNDSSNPATQWNNASASAAWKSVTAAFAANNTQGANFTNFLQDYFHSPPGFSCGVLGSTYCTQPINCGSGLSPNAAVNSPAGYLIVNSLTSLNVQYNNFYDGMQAALNYINGEVGEFVSTFSTELKFLNQKEQEEHTLDEIALGISFLSAFTFNSWLKALPFFKENSNFLGIAKDSTNALATFAINYNKNSLSTPPAVAQQNQVSSYVSGVVQLWVNQIAANAHDLFNDVQALGRLIDQGQLFQPAPQLGPVDLTSTVQKFIYASALAPVWNAGPTNGVPLILNADGLDVTGTGKDGCKTYDLGAWSKYTGQNAADGTWDSGYVCFNGNAYWLISIGNGNGGVCADPQIITPTNPYPPCDKYLASIESLTSIDTLNGTAWGGLTKTDVVENAVNTVNNNLGYNADSPLNLTETSTISTFESGDMSQALGLTGIPVCNITEATNNINSDPNNKAQNGFWPCTNNTAYVDNLPTIHICYEGECGLTPGQVPT